MGNLGRWRKSEVRILTRLCILRLSLEQDADPEETAILRPSELITHPLLNQYSGDPLTHEIFGHPHLRTPRMAVGLVVVYVG